MAGFLIQGYTKKKLSYASLFSVVLDVRRPSSKTINIMIIIASDQSNSLKTSKDHKTGSVAKSRSTHCFASEI